MKYSSRVALFVSRYLPRGYSHLLRYAAKKDSELRDILLPLRLISGRKIRADLSETVFIPIFRSGCFVHEIGENLLCMRLLREGDLVFDIGANIGYTAIIFSHIVGQSGKVIALEPSPRAYNLLARSVEGDANIISLNVAISERNGEVQFNEMETLDTSSIEPTEGGKTYAVMATTLDKLSEIYGIPNFVKIDVEGHEPKVFRGMNDILSSNRPPAILFEALNRIALKDCVAEINTARNKYKIFRVKSETGILSDDLDLEGTNNYLALPVADLDRFQNLFPR